jgi:hypothetical protein
MKCVTTLVLAFSIVAGLGACAAQVSMYRVPASQIDSIDGLVVNHSAPYNLAAVFPVVEGGQKLVTLQTKTFCASDSELCEIHFRGAAFASNKLEVELHPDSSLKRVKAGSTSTAADQVGALMLATKEVGTAIKAINDSKQAPDPTAAENEALVNEIRNLMLQANLKAIQNGQPLPYPEVGV